MKKRISKLIMILALILIAVPTNSRLQATSLNTYELKIDGILQDTDDIPYANTNIQLLIRTHNGTEVFSKTITTDTVGNYIFDESFQFDMDKSEVMDNFLEVVLIPQVDNIKGMEFLALNASVFLNGADPTFANCAMQPEVHVAYDEVNEIVVAKTLQTNNNASGMTFTTTITDSILSISEEVINETNSLNTYELTVDGILQDSENNIYKNTDIKLLVRTISGNEVYSKTVTTDMNGYYNFDEIFQFDMDTGNIEADKFLEVVLIPCIDNIEGMEFLSMNSSVFLNGADPTYANCAIQPEMHIAYDNVNEVIIARTLQANNNAFKMTFTTTITNSTLTITITKEKEDLVDPSDPNPIDPTKPDDKDDSDSTEIVKPSKPGDSVNDDKNNDSIIVKPSIQPVEETSLKSEKAINTYDTTNPSFWLFMSILAFSIIGLKKLRKN